MTLGQIERGRLASQRFRNSLEGDGIYFDLEATKPGMFLLKEFLVSTFDLFFAVEVLGLGSLHDQFLHCIGCYRPFATVRVVTGITGCPSATRIIRNHIVNKIFLTRVGELVRFPGLKEECVAWSNFG